MMRNLVNDSWPSPRIRRPAAKASRGYRLATRAADKIILDTNAHAEYFANFYKIPIEKMATVFVGVEENSFPQLTPLQAKEASEPLNVFFYDQRFPAG